MSQSNVVKHLTLVEAVGEELLPEHVVEDAIRPSEQRQTVGQRAGGWGGGGITSQSNVYR